MGPTAGGQAGCTKTPCRGMNTRPTVAMVMIIVPMRVAVAASVRVAVRVSVGVAVPTAVRVAVSTVTT